MNIQVLQEDLSKTLNTVIKFINTRSTLPILNNFLLEAEKSKLKIKATNLEMSISASLGAKIEKEGSITVPAKTFLDLISSLGLGQITLTLDKEELKVEGPNFSASVPTVPPNDFPKIPETIDKKESFTIESENLINTLNKVLFSAAVDESRPVLNGCLFDFKEDKLYLVTSDGFRLSRKILDLKKKSKN